MNLTWTEIAWQDYLYWQTQDKKTLKRINLLIQDILRNKFDGIGKPEPLKYEFQGCWSRRIDAENHLVYSATDDTVIIYQCRTHYKHISAFFNRHLHC